MSEILAVAGGALSMWLVLHLAYGVFKFKWPVEYMAVHQAFQQSILRKPSRYVAFQVLPVAATTWAVTVTVDRIGGAYGPLASLLGLIGHLSATQIYAMAKEAKSARAQRLSAYRLGAIALAVISWMLGCVLALIAPNLVPQPQEFIEDIWLAALIALLSGAFVMALTSSVYGAEGEGAAVTYSKAVVDVGQPLLDLAFSEALRTGKDPFLAQSLLLAEATQRPRWARRLENMTSLFRKSGTYGIMQVRASRPLSDSESIVQGVASMLPESGLRWSKEEGFVLNKHAVWSVAAGYNGDMPHIETVNDFYMRLVQWGTGLWGKEGVPGQTRVFEVRRYGTKGGIRGVTCAPKVQIRVASGVTLAPETTPRSLTKPSSGILFFEAEVDISEREFTIQEMRNGEIWTFEIPLPI